MYKHLSSSNENENNLFNSVKSWSNSTNSLDQRVSKLEQQLQQQQNNKTQQLKPIQQPSLPKGFNTTDLTKFNVAENKTGFLINFGNETSQHLFYVPKTTATTAAGK